MTAMGAAVVAAYAELGHVAKDGQGNYGKHATIGSVLDAVKPILAKHDLAVVQTFVDSDPGFVVTPFKPGDLARTNTAAGFAHGRTVVVREVLSGDRVRISYASVDDLIVQADNLRPLKALASPSDGDTAQAAADSQTPERLTRDRRLALVELAKAYPYGLTDFELAARTGRKQTSIGKRRWELVDAGMAIDTDERRPSDTGAMAKVWAITTFGLEQLQQGEAS